MIVKTLIMLLILFQINEVLLNFLLLIYNPENNKKCFMSRKSTYCIRMISELRIM